jgi:hypothetical protein
MVKLINLIEIKKNVQYSRYIYIIFFYACSAFLYNFIIVMKTYILTDQNRFSHTIMYY